MNDTTQPRGRATRSVEEIKRDTALSTTSDYNWSRIHDHGDGQPCAIDHADTTDVLNRVLAAEAERHTLLAQAARGHAERADSETRRYRDELEHIENVYRSRTAHLLTASETG